MKFVVLVNPTSGRGRAEGVASRWRRSLESIGCSVVEHSIQEPDWRDACRRSGAGRDALIVIGGDGSVHAAAPIAMELACPIYQVPMGTENLFSREFGMNRSPRTLLSALTRGAIQSIDTATCQDSVMLLMCSVGFDARVVHRLASVRNGPIRHASYVGPILAELRRGMNDQFDVEIDGSCFLKNARGVVIIANSRQYAARLNPAKSASMCDGMLDLVFLPMNRARDIIGISIRGWLGRLDRSHGVKIGRGRHVHLESSDGKPLTVQLDGEAWSEHPPKLDIRIRPASLRVLAPRNRSSSTIDH